ncbi:hypothetical protein J7T55_000119 [Diaporthe amygdali]|uniref:uncharacterized protein n=1 Tax=Phomopsis amygdali TaxID=1214568 RepID=UPI0022FE38B1|nr:uncharacterized protein J7T55_000119 [Diaporthe amygdali]KAJ0108154.1 hypothetical protein J7T55_000119 [Diaporthe amygdali]
MSRLLLGTVTKPLQQMSCAPLATAEGLARRRLLGFPTFLLLPSQDVSAFINSSTATGSSPHATIFQKPPGGQLINYTYLVFTTARWRSGQAQKAVYSYGFDLQGPSDGRASDALDSLGKPAGCRTAPTTWRPALGILPIDPAHFSPASLLCFEGLEKTGEDGEGSCEIWAAATGTLARSRSAKGGQYRALDMTQPEAKRNHPFDGWLSQAARPRRGQAGQVHSTLSLPPLGARPSFVVGCSGPMGRHTRRPTAAKYDCPGTCPLILRGNTGFRLGCHGFCVHVLGTWLMTAICPFTGSLLQGTVQVLLSPPVCRIFPFLP